MRDYVQMGLPTKALGILLVLWSSGLIAQDNVASIIQRSVEANNRDWDADAQFDYTEVDKEKGVAKTYDVTMLYGTPYQRVVAINGHKLSPEQNKQEQSKYEAELAKRKAETPEQRKERIEKFQLERHRDHIMLSQLTAAFDFTQIGQRTLNGRQVYVLQAKPKKGYKPPNRDSQVLPGMEGTLWVDHDTFQWVKVEAHVMHPVHIEGILAKVEPGTRFELEKKPVTGDIWLTAHYAMKASAKVLMMFPHQEQEDVTYFNYHKSAEQQAGGSH